MCGMTDKLADNGMYEGVERCNYYLQKKTFTELHVNLQS